VDSQVLRVLTMNDRELLKRAAKAAGVQLAWNMNVLPNGRPYPVNATTGAGWSPLTDDGDALRLAVRLSLDIFTNDGDGGHTSVGGGTDVFVQEKHGTDPLAATCRAIVRAAAALADSEPT